MTQRVLNAREAYTRWAPDYESENPVTSLDDRAAALLAPATAGLRLLDAGCGTGRRLRQATQSAQRVGVDLVEGMLTEARSLDPTLQLAAADLRALPLRDCDFELVWCRLVIGHVADLQSAYRELARVTAEGGRILVTDFHPAAVAAGHKRTFMDGSGTTYEIEHHVHAQHTHERAAQSAGLRLSASESLHVGPEVRPCYEAANAMSRYHADQGLPLVLALAFQR